MAPIRIDPADVLHSLPAVRGVMTEWMFTEAPAADTQSVAPGGVELDYGHLRNLQEEDIALAARIGVNTIRCAIEHVSLERRDRPGRYNEAGFARVEQLLDWYARYDLRAILDLHNALGREGGGDPRLWQDEAYQDRFVAVWRELARRFAGHPQVIAYEPLNEPEPRYTDDWQVRYSVWNRLARRVTDAIREIDPDRTIIIDSIEYANPSALAALEPTGDPNTAYSFHWYAPTAFHCQKRPWIDDRGTYHYPDTYDGRHWDRRTIEAEWQPALDFAAAHGAPLFCGEFGCVSDTPEMEDMIWLLDVVSLLDRHRIGWTYYHYLFRSAEPFWRDHFDCNLFVRELPSGRLRPLPRKVDLLSDLMKVGGRALRHDPFDDVALLAHAVLLADGSLRIYVSNASRDESRSAELALAGGAWAPNVAVKRMAVGTCGYVDDPPLRLADGGLRAQLAPLTILRLTVRPADPFA